MHRLTCRLKQAARNMLAILLPFRCAACGRLAPPPAPSPDARHDPAAACQSTLRLLCPACRDTMLPVAPPVCSACGIPFDGGAGGDHRCADCVVSPLPIGKMRAAAVFQGAMVLLMHQYKYHRAAHLAAAFRPWLAATYVAHWSPAAVDLVVPVPLHRRRLHQRGFNQAWLLARQVFGQAASPALRRDVLQRLGDTPSQTGLDRDQRRRNLKGVFGVSDPSAVMDKHVLVVDDVVTTGETMTACAGALLDAGARRVDALSMARTLRRIQ